METEQEKRIKEVAEKLFLSKGFNGTSTTEIAREAGCNQALVHYYYRTKERLFQAIFEKNTELILDFLDHYQFGTDIHQIVSDLIEAYFTVLSAHRQLPFFVMNELLLNPDRRELIRQTIIQDERRVRVYDRFCQIVEDEITAGHIAPIDPFQLLFDAISLVVMTFIALPIYQDLLAKDPQQVEAFIATRKQEALTVMRHRLTVQ